MIRVLAPAKVNLSLRVFPPDTTGYHPLDSVVQTVTLTDHITVRRTGDRDRLTVVPPIRGSNLVDVTLARLREAGWPVPPLDVLVEKSIPVSAGLGGGSADVAGVLAAVATWIDDPGFDPVRIGAQIGSDVAALVTGGTVRMTGRGERVAPLAPAQPDTRWLVVTPPFALATADVYRNWDRLGFPTGREVADWPATTALLGNAPRNDLEPAAVDLRPELAEWIDRIGAAVGRRPMVSGSGSSIFVEVDGDDAVPAGLDEARLVVVVAPWPGGPRVESE